MPEGARYRDDGRVLLVSDASPGSTAAARQAFAEAARLGVPLEALVAVDVTASVGPDTVLLPPAVPEVLERSRDALEHFLDPLRRETPEVEVEVTAVPGPLGAAIEERSEEAVLVVTGSRGRGLRAGMLAGSASREVLQGAHRPVMVVKG